MRRPLLILGLSIVLAFILTLPAAAQPTVTVDGRTLAFDVPPVVEQGRTLVPLRAIFEALGADVTWDVATQTVTGAKDTTTVRLTIGSTTAHVSGRAVTLDVPGMIIDGRTLVPLRFVGESLGAEVAYDSATRRIIIRSAGDVPAPPAPTVPATAALIHFIDVGQGDAIYIELPNNIDILIDAGPRGAGSTVVEYLRSRNVDDIEILVATHYHADHIGGMPEVFRAYDIAKVISPGTGYHTRTYEEFMAAVETEGAVHRAATPGLAWTFDEYVFKILGPQREHDNHNNESVVAKLRGPALAVLFTGDAEVEAEADMLQKDIRADVLKVGHHGSRTSTTDAFLAAVSPDVAVIPVGAGNRYGHPHRETLDRLSAAGVKTYRTDLHGTVVIRTDGKRYTVQTQKVPAVQPAPASDPAPTPVPDPAPGKVNINTASLEELQRIVHIGPERAQEIIRLRPFGSVDDLTRVPGIGAGRLADIKAQGMAYVK